MTPDKRKHPRIITQGVSADITLCNENDEVCVHMTGELVDMSYSGLRIKLNNAMPENMSNSRVVITLTLPNSDVQCQVKGQIRHINAQSEVGLHYSQYNKEHDVDDFMFECVKTTAQPIPA